MMALASLLVAAALGYCAVRLWLPGDRGSSPWKHVLDAGLGIGLGIGLTSVLYFLLLLAGLAKVSVISACEVLALCALGAMLLRQRQEVPPDVPALAPPFRWSWIAALGLVAMLALFVAGFSTLSGLNPQGGWDAFAIWNLRARYLLQSETWRYAVTTLPVGTHMEYPLLLSSAVARGWQYAGETNTLAPVAIAFLFPLSLVGLLVSALALKRRTSLGLLAGVVLLAHPALLDQAVSQYSDLPLACFATAALALIALQEEASATRYLTLAGCFAGLATWTKNEGLLLLLAVAAGLLAETWRRGGSGAGLRRCGAFLAGALPVLLLTLWFKMAVAPHDPLAGNLGGKMGETLANPGRWMHVAGGFLQHAWEFALPLVLLAAVAALLRLRPREACGAAVWINAPGFAVATALAGYVLIFVLTPDDLDWLLGTALDRLYLQLWPVLVLAVCLSIRSPEECGVGLVGTARDRKGSKGR